MSLKPKHVVAEVGVEKAVAVFVVLSVGCATVTRIVIHAIIACVHAIPQHLSDICWREAEVWRITRAALKGLMSPTKYELEFRGLNSLTAEAGWVLTEWLLRVVKAEAFRAGCPDLWHRGKVVSAMTLLQVGSHILNALKCQAAGRYRYDTSECGGTAQIASRKDCRENNLRGIYRRGK